MKLKECICARICLLRIFLDHETMVSLNMCMYVLKPRDGTWTATSALIIEGRFIGHLARPAIAIAFGESPTISVKLLFSPTAMSLKKN